MTSSANAVTTHRQTVSLQITQGIGYRGRNGEHAYVAAISGTDTRYGFVRAFLDATSVERDHFGRARYTRTYTYDLAPGAYEVSEHGERRYLLVWGGVTRDVTMTRVSPDRVQEIAVLMDGGRSYREAREQTRPTATTQA